MSAPPKVPLLSAVLYATVSLVMVLLNKTVMTVLGFAFPNTIMVSQMVATLIFIEILRLFKVITVPAFNLKAAKNMLLPGIFYALHGFCSLSALSGISVPMYGTIKHCSPIFNLFCTSFIVGKPCPDRKIVAAIFIAAFGAMLAAMNDLVFDPKCYLFGGMAIMLQATNQTLIERLSIRHHNGAVEMLRLGSVYGLFVHFTSGVIGSEYGKVIQYVESQAESKFWVSFVILNLFGTLLNFAMYLSTVQNSALTTSVVGEMKTVVQAGLGYVLGMHFFNDVLPNFWNVCGILINLGGCVFYTYHAARGNHPPGKIYHCNGNGKVENRVVKN